MRVDHRGLDIGVAQVVLDLPDVHAVEQQVGCEAVPQRVDRGGFVDARLPNGGLHGFLDDGIADVVAAHDACAGIE